MKIRVLGALLNASGYGEAARNLVRALRLAGYSVSIGYFNNPLSKISKEELKEFSSDHTELPDLEIQVIIPEAFAESRNSSIPTILYSVMEGRGKILPSWAEASNLADEVWLPSRESQETFLNGGVNKPTRIVPHFINTDIWKPIKKIKNKFTFLSVFDYQSNYRKGIEILIGAYLSTFHSEERVRLVLKFQKGYELTFKNRLERALIQARMNKIPEIGIISEDWPVEKMIELYQNSDCFVLPSRGEGFLYPALQGMASGLPAMVPEFGGFRDYCNEENSFLIKVEKWVDPPATEKFYKYVKWVEPSLPHLRRLLRFTFDNSQLVYLRGLKARETALNYSLQEGSKMLKNLLKDFERRVIYNGEIRCH